MENKKLFKNYHMRLAVEGMIKSLVFGFIIGFAAAIIPAFIIFLINTNGLWLELMNFNGLWLLICIVLAVTAAATPLFYFVRFRPTSKQIAERVDRLGLEERLITMLELEKDESYIAMRQREDAKEKLSANRKRLKLSLFIAPIVAVAILAVCSSSIVGVAASAFNERIPWYEGYDPNAPKQGDLIDVSYEASEGGLIFVQNEQLTCEYYQQKVFFGENANTVLAIADKGYAFVRWVNNMEDVRNSLVNAGTAERTDSNVQAEINVTAEFTKLDDSEGVSSPDEYDPQPPEPEPPTPEPTYETIVDWIIDGETYYRVPYQQYLEDALRILSEGGEIPAYLKRLVEQYFKIIV